MTNLPQRSCVICRAQKNKNELLRIVKNKDNIVKVDERGKESGRGAYICYNLECLEKAKKSKRIEKSLEFRVDYPLWLPLAQGEKRTRETPQCYNVASSPPV